MGRVVRITGWEKYNGRKDVKNCTWFRVENSISSSEALFGLDADERFVFIEICAQASRKQSSEIRINEAFIAERAKAKESRVESALEKLINNNTVGLVTEADESDRICTDPDGSGPNRQTNKHTNKTDITNTDERTPQDFDFDSCYLAYPRKIGKAEGLARAKKLITSSEDYDAFCLAVKNYSQYVQAQGTEEKYIKHFSSFVGVKGKEPWRDYIDPVQASPAGAPENAATRRSRGNQYALEQALAAIGADDEQAS